MEVNGFRTDLTQPLPVPGQKSKQLNADVKNMRCCLLSKLKFDRVISTLFYQCGISKEMTILVFLFFNSYIDIPYNRDLRTRFLFILLN